MKVLSYLTFVCLLPLFFSCESEGYDEKGAEEKRLVGLYAEIEALSKQEACEDASQWEYTAIGSKPCGGPSGYIAYSTQIDTEYFLSRVALYTTLHEEFNKKWGINSDCAVEPVPIGVECVDGEARLIYTESQKPEEPEAPGESEEQEEPGESEDESGETDDEQEESDESAEQDESGDSQESEQP